MKLIEQRFLRGPNLYAQTPCMAALIELEAGDPGSSAEVPGFTDALLAVLPGLTERHPGSTHPEGFAPLLRLGTDLVSTLEQSVLELQRITGAALAFSNCRAVAGQPARYQLVWAFASERVAGHALELALELLDACTRGLAFDVEEALTSLKRTASRYAIGTSTGAVLRSARQRDIPFIRLTPEANLFQLGWGKRQRRLQATITGATSNVAVGIASDKQLTKTLLAQAGLPVPDGTVVTSVEQAIAAAGDLHAAVTIKPLDGNHGKGVTTTCRSVEDIESAFTHAREFSRRVIVERFLSGRDYRVLVTGRKVAAAALRRPPEVRGDGVSTVRQLVQQENRNPARGQGHSNILTQIAMDEHAQDVLAKQGVQLDDVVPEGAIVALRDNANLSSGGTAEDVTDLLPPDTVRDCVRAARAVGLDIAGIDIVCNDISVPLREQGGGIIEVNAAPGIRMHEYPSHGTPRDAGAHIIEAMFGDGDGRIPVVAVSGSKGKSTVTRMVAHALLEAGLAVGTATSNGIAIDGETTQRGDSTGFDAARTVLADSDVELALLETSLGSIVGEGLGFDRCDVAAILNLDDGAEGAAVLARAAVRSVVLNADDARCTELIRDVDPEVAVLYFSLDADNPVLLRHLASGASALYLHDDEVVLADGERHQVLMTARVADDPSRKHIANVLAAAATLMGAGFGVDAVAAGLAVFVCANEEVGAAG